MNHIKPRLLFLGLLIVSIILVFSNWHQLLMTHKYSMKVAAFAPLCGVGGLFLMAFPTMAGKPHTVKEKTLVTIVLVIGLIAGLANWYLMDPGFFRH
ncbi:MAG: hypothetical protein ABIZ64_02360 [Casimicrobium sp.]|jgi:hypothetical protein